MIFSGTSPDGRKHIDLIFSGEKTQTRRPTDRYQAGKAYAIQPKRCAKADTRGRLLIHDKALEMKGYSLLHVEAWAEGGYTPEQYDALYERMYPGWQARWVYYFEVVRFQDLERDMEFCRWCGRRYIDGAKAPAAGTSCILAKADDRMLQDLANHKAGIPNIRPPDDKEAGQ